MNMKKFTAKTISNDWITLASDDTFTLGIWSRGSIDETTPQWLAENISLSFLAQLAEAGENKAKDAICYWLMENHEIVYHSLWNQIAAWIGRR
jgi:hypothetical protein